MFQKLHPAVQFTYFVVVIGLGMFVRNPLIQAELLLLSLASEQAINSHAAGDSSGGKRKKTTTKNLHYPGFLFAIILLSALINMLTYHDGIRVLFYINENPITAEAGIYGMTVGLMIVTTLSWFKVYQKVLTQDKFLYLFGRISPALAMTVSMVFRYIPLLQRRMEEINRADRAMGVYRSDLPLMKKMKVKTREFSVLISWSLEQSIETSQAMEARGYGAKNRSSYHRFLFYRRDGMVLSGVLVLTAVAVICLVFGFGKTYFYPEFAFAAPGAKLLILAMTMLLLGGLPVLLKERSL